MRRVIDKFEDMKDWGNWIDRDIVKHSGKPFYSGLKIGTPKELTINPHSGKQAFLMGDGKVVDCHQCKLK